MDRIVISLERNAPMLCKIRGGHKFAEPLRVLDLQGRLKTRDVMERQDLAVANICTWVNPWLSLIAPPHQRKAVQCPR
jgi:hypothetical protein